MSENQVSPDKNIYNVLMQDRIKKLNQIRACGVNPYPYKYEASHTAREIIAAFDSFSEADWVTVAGRVMSIRKMGGASFMHIQDKSGKIQIYLNSTVLGKEQYDFIDLLDIGDIIGVGGTVMKTRTGEISVRAKEITLLTKSVRPLPEKYHGLTDMDIRYRHRSVDMIMNSEVREVFLKRAAAIKAIRDFMSSRGIIELETPILTPKYGGADAKPFITHYNALNHEAFLSISPELYLKRLVVGGIDRVYTLTKAFRNEGIDRSHSPEFTLLECYLAYADYNDMMRLTEELYEYVFMQVNGSTKINYQGQELDFKAPWQRRKMTDIIFEYTGIEVDRFPKEELIKELSAKNITFEDVELTALSKGEIILLLFEQECEKHLIQPTFVIDYPKESSPLCKIHRLNSEYIERFEPFVNGIEIGNAYSELNDPIRQRQLLEEQARAGRGGMEAGAPVDEEFLNAMEVGMPPTGGLGLGIDRMIMFVTNSYSIKDVIPFVFMKNL